MSSRSLTVYSPAKINLNLRVLGVRPDGYHEIYTLFQRISLSDRIRFRKKKQRGISLRCDSPLVPLDSSNLIAKAYRLLYETTGFREGVEVCLEKQIPPGGGLGGGSSNAAYTLLALNRLFGLGLQQHELVYLGKKIGADVAFFLLNTSQAIGKGKGDELSPLKFKRKLPLTLIFSTEGLSTKNVYEHYKPVNGYSSASLTKVSADTIMISDFLSAKDLSRASRLLCNDLMQSAFQIKPAIGRVLFFLRDLSRASLMTGSGPTLFALTQKEKDAGQIAEKVRKKFGLKAWTGWTF